MKPITQFHSFLKNVIFIVLIFVSASAIAQKPSITNGAWNCYQQKIHNKVLTGTKSPNSPRHSFDVLKYTLNLDLFHCYSSPYPHSYTANEIIRFKVDTALSAIKLNAVNTSIVIDSINMSGISFTQLNDILTITLNRSYNPGEITEVMIFYHHLDVSDNAFYTGNGMVFTDCEPEGARNWFPCWDKPSDKALSDLTAKVPVGVLFGSNGSLQDSTVYGDSLYYHWVNHDSIATYLMVMTSKVGYNLDVVYWPMLTDSTKKIPMRFYYNTGENPVPMENIICDMTSFYSTLFGVHPFEKNGFAALNNQFPWGGMENQTLTSICPNCWYSSLISHEFAHQWFGDMISPGTWADIFLNEGFATYCEALWDEHVYGYTQYKSDVVSDANDYLSSNPGWAIYNPSWAITTPNVNTLFNYAITYEKGACVLHMFRYTVGDSLFFASIKSYATDTVNFKYKNAVIPDFITKMNQTSGQNLNWFFNEWLSEPNHPVYANIYNFINNGNGTWTVNFTTNQSQTNAPFFQMPIQLQVKFSGGSDTMVKVMNNSNNQLFSFTFNKQPDSLKFDPNDEIVLKQATTTITGINQYNDKESFINLYQNNPNPFSDKTQIAFDLPAAMPVKIVVYDVYGKTISVLLDKTMSSGNHHIEFKTAGIQKGIYYYCLETGHRTIVKKMMVM
jgi:aminopeptidase N